MLLQAFYSVRSERPVLQRIEFDLLFRWFVGISNNRDRLLEGEIKFLSAVLTQR